MCIYMLLPRGKEWASKPPPGEQEENSWKESPGISQAKRNDIWRQKGKRADQKSAFQHAKGG